MSVAASTVRTVSGLGVANRVSVSVIEQALQLTYNVPVGTKTLRFQTIGRLPLFRARTLFSKEPETITWIRTFAADDVLFDVGANVGMYSIYASAFCRRVYAFEPVFTNYFILNSNILLNDLSQSVRAFCVALSDEHKIDSMRLRSVGLGEAFNSFAENVTEAETTFQPVFEQGACSFTLDALVYEHGLECPTHVKIDVDGLEGRIVRGARRLLSDRRLKTILIELNRAKPADQAAVAHILESGFIAASQGSPETSAGGITFTNLIFVRKD